VVRRRAAQSRTVGGRLSGGLKQQALPLRLSFTPSAGAVAFGFAVRHHHDKVARRRLKRSVPARARRGDLRQRQHPEHFERVLSD
jgi:hypothetical protein